MKKLQKILVVCMVFTLITAMAGCGEKASKYEGTWELNKVKASGMFVDNPAEMGMQMKIIVSKDGKGTLILNKEKNDMTWKDIDGGVEISDGKDTLKAIEQKDGTLKLKFEGMEMYMKKAKK